MLNPEITMKKKLRDMIIVLFYLIGIPYLRFLWLTKKHGPLVRIIAFHGIGNNQVDAFKKKLKFLKKNFNIISPKQFYNQEFSKKKLNMLLTFDDGYKSWLKNVVPCLKEEGLSAILFIPSGFIEAGGNNQNKYFYASRKLWFTAEKKPLSWKDVKRLDEIGFEIGGHTVSHKNLQKMDRRKVLQEIKEDKKKIEQVLEHKIISFAYPFGDIQRMSKKVIARASQVGYRYAFSTLPGFNNKNTEKFLLNRDCLKVVMPNILLRAWIYGSYDFIKRFLNIFKQAKIK